MQPVRSRRGTSSPPATDATTPRRRWVPIDEVLAAHEAAEERRSLGRQLRHLVDVPVQAPRPSRTRRWDREEERTA